MCREAAPSIDLCQPDDVMYVLSSSGSSGYSKLIPHSHREAVAIGSLGFGQGTSDQDTAKEFSVRPLGEILRFVMVASHGTVANARTVVFKVNNHYHASGSD